MPLQPIPSGLHGFGEALKGFGFFGFTDAGFSHRVGEDLDGVVVGFSVDGVGVAVFAAVGVRIVGPFSFALFDVGEGGGPGWEWGGGVSVGGGGVVDQLGQEGEGSDCSGADALGAQEGGEVLGVVFVGFADDFVQAVEVDVLGKD